MSGAGRRDVPAAVVVALCAGLTVAGGVVGFAVSPDGTVGNLWDTICSATGVRGPDRSSRVASSIESTISWTARTVGRARGGNAAHGAFIGGNCTACHGTAEAQARWGAPDLAALGHESVYKEMIDYRTGRRVAPVMQAIAASLSDAEQADVAAWAETLPKPQARNGAADADIERLVLVGDPSRGIGACAACHGPAGIVPAAPSLYGQTRLYIEQQLLAFANGTRHNDLNRQMRSAAWPLTADEVRRLARYYGADGATGAGAPATARTASAGGAP